MKKGIKGILVLTITALVCSIILFLVNTLVGGSI